MKKPEEIKKALACVCERPDCENCAYAEKVNDEEFGKTLRFHCSEIYADALAYIQQLESRLAQIERERDAAVADLTVSAECDFCEYKDLFPACGEKSCYSCDKGCPCSLCCKGGAGFKWRGVCEENTKEEEK